MRIVHFQRRPLDSHFSIEQLFEAIRRHLPVEWQPEVAICPEYSRGLLPRIRNTRFARKQQGDLNHITGDVHYIALGLPKAKTVLTIHDLGFLDHPRPLVRWVLKKAWLDWPLRKVRYVTTISTASKMAILKAAPFFPAERIRVIPNILPQAIDAEPKAFNSTYPRILLIGTKANKNLSNTLQALQGIPCQVHLIGEYKPEVEALLKNNELDYQYDSKVPYAAVLQAYRDCDLLLFASTFEGFGMPIIEAQAMGRVVLTSKVSSMPEVAGRGACLVDPLNPEAIRAGLASVLQDESYRQALIQAGFENVKRFEAAQIARQYVDLYQEILN
ncbi:MAG: glycosyltransferase family 4 protein [Phaeodactylibacter sp.]|nr:glycosyltransferase family 4 protein [Phaeodactylibacter sp.]